MITLLGLQHFHDSFAKICKHLTCCVNKMEINEMSVYGTKRVNIHKKSSLHSNPAFKYSYRFKLMLSSRFFCCYVFFAMSYNPFPGSGHMSNHPG